MASFLDSINKGFATINVKTSNLMESTKLKTAITGRESEIETLIRTLGETVYANRSNFSMEMISELINEINKKYSEIEDFKKQISQLEINERNILGTNETEVEAKVYCTQCGAPNKIGNKFCEKCGYEISE